MTEHRETDAEDQPATDREQGRDQSDGDPERHAAELKERGAAARPRAEDPAAVEPGKVPPQ